jgi:hypothetical protein
MMSHPGPRPGHNKITKEYCNGRHNEHKDDVVHSDGLWEKRPVEERLLRYAAQDVEHLCEAAHVMMSVAAMRRDPVLLRTEMIVLRVELQHVVRGPHSTRPDGTSKYATLFQLTADAFSAYMLADPELRQKCQDKTMFKAEYLKWRDTTLTPSGTKYVGAFGKMLAIFLKRNLIINRGVDDEETIVWSVDVGDGRTPGEARRTASEAVRGNRAHIEADKLDVRVGPVVGLPESAPVGKALRSTVRVENVGGTTLVLRAARFLQAIGSRAVKPIFQASVPGLPWPLRFPPHTYAEVEIICTPTFGINRDLLELDFGAFSVGRFLELSAGDAALHDALKPVAPFERKKRKRAPLQAEAVVSDGEKPQSGAPRWQRDAGDHEIPRALADQLWSGELEEALEPLRERMMDPKGLPRDLATNYPR